VIVLLKNKILNRGRAGYLSVMASNQYFISYFFRKGERKMKGIIQCPICGHNHDYKINHQVLAFACSFLNGVIHLPFYSAKDIEEHKKETEPKTRRKENVP